MQPVLNLEDVKRVEQALTGVGVSISELMHRAGAAAAREVLRLKDVHKVVIFCGLGNNGGDGWVCALALMQQGVDVCVITPVAPDDLRADLARVVAKSAQTRGVRFFVAPPKDEIDALLLGADTVIDAMLGTGFRGEVRTPFNLWIQSINQAHARVVSLDVPSGLSAQTGLAQGECVWADMTVTMLVLKPGLLSDMGRDVCGAIIVAPLAEQTGALVREADPVAWRADLDDYLGILRAPSNAQDKFSRGSVLVVGGSLRYPGAAALSALAAARAGAGYVTLAVPAPVAPLLQTQLLDIPVIGLPADEEGVFTTEAGKVISQLAQKRTACVVGPGMRVSSGSVSVVSNLLTADVPLVIDADGLNCLTRLTSGSLDSFPELLRRRKPLVLTPHRSELGRLVGLSTAPESLTAAMEAARRIVWAQGGSEVCVVAKGSATACVSVEAAVLPKPGPACLATAGSGDVLSGIMGTYLARGEVDNDDLAILCSMACELHGVAGELAQGQVGSQAVMAHDLVEVLGRAQDQLDEEILFNNYEE